MTGDDLKAELYQRAADAIRPAPKPKSRSRAMKERMQRHIEHVARETEERVRRETGRD